MVWRSLCSSWTSSSQVIFLPSHPCVIGERSYFRVADIYTYILNHYKEQKWILQGALQYTTDDGIVAGFDAIHHDCLNAPLEEAEATCQFFPVFPKLLIC